VVTLISLDDHKVLDEFYHIVRQVPEGRVTTYGAVALALGDIRASRAVGLMLNRNQYAPSVPCHRVVMGDGSLGGFATGSHRKELILRKEEVLVAGGKIDNFKSLLFGEFCTERILELFRKEQMELSLKVSLEDSFNQLNLCAGADVSYQRIQGSDKDLGVGALVLWDLKKNEIIDVKYVSAEVRTPYIPTYLSYRELPLILELVKSFNDWDILILDGNGVIHPLGLGLASHAGVLLNRSTIGVAKKLLKGCCERINVHGEQNPGRGKRRASFKIPEEAVPLIRQGEVIGYEYLPTARCKNPIYISPGHRISPQTTLDTVKSLCRFRIPEPLRQAHLLANEKRKKMNDLV